uniref:Secreted protein n=1 Tax=Anopheles coluzzii TaxID=1518534 RepID=A0A8W7PL43_ANOCL
MSLPLPIRRSASLALGSVFGVALQLAVGGTDSAPRSAKYLDAPMHQTVVGCNILGSIDSDNNGQQRARMHISPKCTRNAPKRPKHASPVCRVGDCGK